MRRLAADPAIRPVLAAGPALALALLAAAATPALGARGVAPITVDYPAPRPSEAIVPKVVKGVRYVSTNDLARVFSATKYWRPEIQKLSLRFGEHTARLTVDAPVVLIGDEAVNLVAPVRLIQGVVYAPQTILDELFERGLFTEATWDESARLIRFRSPVHSVRQAHLYTRGRVTEIAATLQGGSPPRVLYATPTDLLVLFEGGTLDTARVFGGGIVTGGSIRDVPGGVELRLHLGEDAKGYNLSVVSTRLKVAVTDDGNLVEAGLFSPLDPVPLGGPERNVRTIIIDPGHGGADAGEPLPGGIAEKDAALDIARALKAALSQRLPAHILLTRAADNDLTAQRRAEIANQVGADLFISIHLDAEGAIRGGGFRVYTLSPIDPGAGGGRAPAEASEEIEGVPLRPWSDAQSGIVGSSMAVAQAVSEALVQAFPQSPVILDTGALLVTEPVLCPAILIESAPAARAVQDGTRGYTVYEYTQVLAGAIERLVRAAGS